MSERITKQDLERQVEVLNGYFGIRDSNAVGRFEIEYAYGDCRLVRILNEGNGERDMSKRGTKREIYEKLYAINKVIYEFKDDFGIAVDKVDRLNA